MKQERLRDMQLLVTPWSQQRDILRTSFAVILLRIVNVEGEQQIFFV
jgi:hypothetical protein